jgi:hypothetical protein
MAYGLLRSYQDTAGEAHSDWGMLIYYATQHGYGWRYCREIVLGDVLVPVVLGWAAHGLLLVAWDLWQQRRRAAEPVS